MNIEAFPKQVQIPLLSIYIYFILSTYWDFSQSFTSLLFHDLDLMRTCSSINPGTVVVQWKAKVRILNQDMIHLAESILKVKTIHWQNSLKEYTCVWRVISWVAALWAYPAGFRPWTRPALKKTLYFFLSPWWVMENKPIETLAPGRTSRVFVQEHTNLVRCSFTSPSVVLPWLLLSSSSGGDGRPIR